jgi:nucleoside-diphosphate-sugar epimerase
MGVDVRYFITGGTGFIGSHLINYLLATGHEVVATYRTNPTTRISITKQPVWLQRELDEITAKDLAGCDVLVNLASAGMPNNPEKVSFEDMYHYNVTCLVWLLGEAHKAGVRKVMLCSTFKEYGSSAADHDFIPTTAPLRPTTAFACSRVSAYMAAKAFSYTFPMDIEYIRFFNVYGEGENALDLWTALKNAAIAGDDFPMTGGEQVRDYISVDTVTARLEEIGRSESVPGLKVSHIASGEPIRLRDFTDHWWEEWGGTGKIVYGALPYRPYEAMRIVAAV